jgi:hypothetical protein
MKPNLDKRFIYAGVGLIVLIIAIIIINGLNHNNGTSNEALSSAPTTESAITHGTSEWIKNTMEHDYVYVRPKLQRRVIAIRVLAESEIPKPFDFTEFGKAQMDKGHFYSVVILDIDTDVRLKTETITEVAELEIINTFEATDIEQIYRQLEIRYEDDHAVYKHDRQYFVTSLNEPRLFRKYAIYDSIIPLEPIFDTNFIDIYRTPSQRVYFSISEQQFSTIPENAVLPVVDTFSWEGKTINHTPTLTSVQGPSFKAITDEPRLNKFALGASSAVVFERLGMPISVKWLLGYYLNYDDLSIYASMGEKGDTLTFDPVYAVFYTGDYPVAGLQKGMTFKEVEKIIGPQPALTFTAGDEMTYPLSMGIKNDGFTIKVGFDPELKVSQFYIRIDNEVGGVTSEDAKVFEPMPSNVALAFSEEYFESVGLEQFTDFATGTGNCYFNATTVSSDGISGIDIGFYTYDLSRREPTLVSDQPMKMFFELLHDANPSVITIGKEDGVIYKIDLNTFVQTPMSGPNYKDYVVRGEAVIKASLTSDALFLENYGLFASETIGQFDVSVPKDWNVRYGDYPEGLYWSLANVFSSEIGLDLRAIKGKTVSATVYRLSDGLKAPDRVSEFRYPSNVVILRDNGQIKGAWLNFNTSSIGPSLRMHDLEEITGKTFDAWVWDEGVFVLTTSYLPSPDATIQNFFDAIQTGDKPSAYRCLRPSSFLRSLTTNLDFSKGLYHDAFNTNNSLVENIISVTDVEIVSYFDNQTFKPIENSQAYFDAMPLGTRIEVELSLKLDWRDKMFNTEGKDTRFVLLEKTPYGWKLDGLATGR